MDGSAGRPRAGRARERPSICESPPPIRSQTCSMTDSRLCRPRQVLSAFVPATKSVTGASGPLRGRQDADHREGAREDVQAAVVGGDMLVTI